MISKSVLIPILIFNVYGDLATTQVPTFAIYKFKICEKKEGYKNGRNFTMYKEYIKMGRNL